jgi:hypothetical protein
MTGDTQPNAEFAASLRAWFVAEMQRPEHEDGDHTVEPTAPDLTLVDPDGDDRARRTPRGWLLLAQAAAAFGVVAGLWWASSRPSEPPIPASAPVTPATIASDPSAVAHRACEEFRTGASDLALGASPDEIVRAASDLRTRLTAAAARLDEPPDALADSRRLAAEAIDATGRLIAVADQDRATVDSAVRNLDLIVTAWSRELSSVAEDDACDGLPTLREVF